MPRTAPSVQVYGKTNPFRVGTASIYGDIQITQYESTIKCICESTVDPLDALRVFLEFLQTLYKAVENFYVTTNVNSPLVAFMSVTGAMKFGVFVRLTWGKLNPDRKFNPNSLADINALKDIYLSFNRDWRSDNFLVTKTFELHMSGG